MNKLCIVVKNELLRYFISPLAYVYLIAFLILNGSFAIYFGNFFNRGQADLLSMFIYNPWLYLLFIPGISMRLWSEEFRNRTVIQIMTMPVSTTTLVWGKFFASWIFCAIALALTFPFWITVNILGNPDNSVIALSYLGSLTLAGCMLAISQTMSALTKNQVIALVLSVIANLLFFLSGIEYVLAFFRLFSPSSIIDMIASFSFLSHFEIITQGLLELRDIIFFASIILLFNITTIFIINFKTSGTSKLLKSGSKSAYIFTFIILLLGFIGLNLSANNLLRGYQYDFTADKSFTLSDTSKFILQNLPEPITAKLYFSKELEQRNPRIRNYFDKIRLTLREFSKISGGKFNYKIYSPKPLNKDEDIAYAEGLQPIPLIKEGQNVFFGMTILDDIDNKVIIPFFPMERQEYVEQDLIQKIYQLSFPKKTVGILTHLPIYEEQLSDNYVTQDWEVLNQIKNLFEVKTITEAKDISDIDVLMIIHPQNLSKEMISAIKDYSNSGGNSLVLVDVAPEASRIFSPVNLELVPSDLGELADFWGFSFYNDAVVADLENSITVDATKDYQSNPIFVQDVIQFITTAKNFNKKAPELHNLNKILFASASALRPTAENINFIPLIEASKNSSLMYADVVYRQMHPSFILSKFEADDYAKVIAAKIINKDPTKRFELIVVADTDFIYDSFWSKSQSVLDNNYVIPLFDNINFILNSLESLSGGYNLIELRGKSQTPRIFEKIENIRKTAQQDFKVKENIVFNKIDDAKHQLQNIWSKREFEQRETFSSDELATISNIRQELDILRKELVQIKENQDLDIKRIDFYVKLINIYSVPLLIILLLIFISLMQKKTSKSYSSKLELSRSMKILALTSIALLALGISSIYLTETNEVDEYKNKLVFDNLANEINDVSKIEIKNNKATLSFEKKNNIWILTDYPNIPVYQERIKGFLSTLIQASYFEKKSNKVEHLSKFGLQPIETEGSQNTNITLLDDKNKKIIDFEIGKYDLDIGRGSKAAYIKFRNQFQVWMIEADFVDLSTKWRDWTYSTIWNLNLGRLKSANQDTHPESLMGLAKIILNTQFITSEKDIKSPNKLMTLKLKTENDSLITLDFFKKDNKYYVQYDFVNIKDFKDLQFFTDYVKRYYFEISQTDFERIRNAAPK